MKSEVKKVFKYTNSLQHNVTITAIKNINDDGGFLMVMEINQNYLF